MNPLHAIQRQHIPYAELAKRYDRVASGWDATLKRLGFNAVYTDLFADLQRDGLLDSIGADGHVLDVGIGTGGLSAALLARTPAHITGIDISAAMLEVAEARLNKLGASYTLQLADFDSVACAGRRFDFAMAAHVIEHVENPVVSLACVRRMLLPGGRFLLVITRRGLWGSYLHLKWGIHTATVADVYNWFEQAGFQSVQRVPLRGNALSPLASIAVVGRR